MMTAIGQLLLWFGFLAGSLATVWNLENSEAKWATIPWGTYAAAATVAAAGAIVLQLDRRSKRQASHQDEGSFAEMAQALASLAETMDQLEKTLAERTCEETLEYIDEKCMPDIVAFVDQRHLISVRYGNNIYAQVMTEFATGERYMNRAWSAAADGYIEEVENCVTLSAQFYSAAVRALPRD